MPNYEKVTLTRDCVAAMVPSGTEVTLPEGDEVRIAQSLGGSYTIISSQGQMLRISGDEADALGKVPTDAVPTEENGKPRSIEDQAWDHLRTCYDPEIPVDIVELGLIYELKIEGSTVSVKMTLTAPGCGMGDVLATEAKHKINKIPGVEEVTVQIVWDPVWDRSMMSEAAKLELGMM